MPEQQKLGWLLFEGTVTGHYHKLNQDAIRSASMNDGSIAMMAVADGHGSHAYFRSHEGARFAAEIAVSEMKNLVSQFQFPIKNVHTVEYLLKQLPTSIVKKWQDQVYEDWQKYYGDLKTKSRESKASDSELETFKLAQQVEQTNPQQPVKPYGSTLLGVLVTPSFIFSFQIGDGDLLGVFGDMQIQRLLQDDKRLLANETTSLCAPNAVRDFRQSVYWLKNHDQAAVPELIMLSTDGYANSFNTKQDFFRVGPDILRTLRTRDVTEVEQKRTVFQQEIESWLQTTTESGSGDDITLGLLWNCVAANNPTRAVKGTSSVEQDMQANDQENRAVQANGESAQDKFPLLLGSEYVRSMSIKAHNDIIAHLETMSKEKPVDTNNILQQDVIGSPNSSNTEQGVHQHISKTEPPTVQPDQSQNSITCCSQDKVEADGISILYVSQRAGHGNYITISDAIKHADIMTKIYVEAGIYEERLLIDKDIEIECSSREGSVILRGEIPCLTISALATHIDGLTIQGQGEGQNEIAAVEIKAGVIRFDKCSITSPSALCIKVSGMKAHASFYFCNMHDSEGTGVVFCDNATGILENCNVDSNRLAF